VFVITELSSIALVGLETWPLAHWRPSFFSAAINGAGLRIQKDIAKKPRWHSAHSRWPARIATWLLKTKGWAERQTSQAFHQ
jgi:hypothetical protein